MGTGRTLILTRSRTRYGTEPLNLDRPVENLPPAHWRRELWGKCHWTHRDLYVPDQFFENPGTTLSLMTKKDYERGVYIEGAFGRRDYMYVYEVAPWAYDKLQDHLKVDVYSLPAVDISDDWTRKLGQVDIARILGADLSETNAMPSRLSDGSAYYDSRDRNWNLGDSDVPDVKDRATRDLGYVYGSQDQKLQQKAATLELMVYDYYLELLLGGGLPGALDSGALKVREQNWPVSYPVTNAGLTNLDVLLSTRALETGGNLASVKTNTDPLVAPAAGAYVRQDLTGTIAKEAGGNLASIKTNTDNLSDVKTDLDTLTKARSRWNDLVQDGKCYYVSGLVTSPVSATQYYPVYIKNPVGSGKTVRVWAMDQGVNQVNSALITALIVDTTTTADGTALTPRNLKRSGAASTITCYQNPTVTSAEIVVFATYTNTSVHVQDALWYELDPGHTLLTALLYVNATAAGYGRSSVWFTEE